MKIRSETNSACAAGAGLNNLIAEEIACSTPLEAPLWGSPAGCQSMIWRRCAVALSLREAGGADCRKPPSGGGQILLWQHHGAPCCRQRLSHAANSAAAAKHLPPVHKIPAAGMPMEFAHHSESSVNLYNGTATLLQSCMHQAWNCCFGDLASARQSGKHVTEVTT